MIIFRKCVQSIPKRGQGLQNINLTIEEGEFVSIIGLRWGREKHLIALDQSFSADH